MRISIASYAFHGLVRSGMMDVFGYLETVRYRYGLLSADIWNGMLPTLEEDYVLNIKEALEERQLELANLCVDKAHIWEDDPDAREQNQQNAWAHLRAAARLGAKTVRIDAGSRAEAFTHEQLDLIVARYREYCGFAGDHGFRVGPENHWGPERTLEGMRAIHDGVDHPAFGVLLHYGNWQGEGADGGDAMVAPWAMHTHLSWAVTEGDLQEEMNLLRKAGYEGYWGIEHHTGENEYTEVAVQLARVKDVLDRWRKAAG